MGLANCCSLSSIRMACMGLFFFLSGVEYAVILPTLNTFLHSLHANSVFLGITLSAFSFAGLISAPIYGRITDKTDSSKYCVIIGNLFEIVGNFLYFASKNKYMVLGGRFLAGIGSGAASSIFGTLSKTSTVKERTSAFSLLMALRQFGLLVGPAFNVFLSKLDGESGPLPINSNTAPGLFMMGLWFLHTVMTILVYKDTPTSDPSTKQGNGHAQSEENGKISAEKYKEIGEVQTPKTRSFFNEFSREEVIVCLMTTFTIMFVETGLEAVVTPLTLLFFDWNGLQNSYFFCAAGAIIMISFVVCGLLSKCIEDRLLLLVGSVLMGFAYVIFLVYTALLNNISDEKPSWLFPTFCIDTALLMISIPLVWAPQASLFSKITSVETQAFNQGVRLVALRLGQILGPLWAASLATSDKLPLMAAVDLALMVLIIFLTALSYKRLAVPKISPWTEVNTSEIGQEEEESDSERTHLLGKTSQKMPRNYAINE